MSTEHAKRDDGNLKMRKCMQVCGFSQIEKKKRRKENNKVVRKMYVTF